MPPRACRRDGPIVGIRRPLRPSSIGGIVARLIRSEPSAHRPRDPDPATMIQPAEDRAMTDPTDDTQPQPSADSGPPAAPESPPDGGSGPSLRADPDRPADSGWREPAWFPPRDRDRRGDRNRRSGTFAIVVGLVMIAIGAYYFLDRTLGIAMPRIQLGSLWPIVLIVVGGLIIVRSFQRKA
jgi:uncharacterized membrane protein